MSKAAVDTAVEQYSLWAAAQPEGKPLANFERAIVTTYLYYLTVEKGDPSLERFEAWMVDTRRGGVLSPSERAALEGFLAYLSSLGAKKTPPQG